MSRSRRIITPDPPAEATVITASEPAPEGPAVIPALTIARPVAPIRPPATRWRVVKDSRYATNGCVTWVVAGQVVSLDGHGEDGIRKMREQGIELEEVY